MTKSDSRLRDDVIDELAFDPTVEASDIGVTARDGVVSLTGTVRNYPEKQAAKRAAKRVAGVRGIADELKISIPSPQHRSDADLARAALVALDWDVAVPKGKITAAVEDAWLTLEGEVDTSYQKDAAARAVANLIGLRGVTNAVTVKAAVLSGDVRTKIRQAFERNAEIDANKVQVEIMDGAVTLRGNVHSWTEHDEAAYAALSVPGVRVVNNQTQVVS